MCSLTIQGQPYAIFRRPLERQNLPAASAAELESERAAADRTFNKREKQVRAEIRNIAAFYGRLQGVAEGALQPVAAMELPPRSDEEPGPLALAS
jgi:hypothetical protein